MIIIREELIELQKAIHRFPTHSGRHVHEKDCVIQILSIALELNDEKYMSNAICRARNFAFKIAEVSYNQSGE